MFCRISVSHFPVKFLLNPPLCFKGLQFLTSQPSEKLCVSAGLELSQCWQRPSFCLTPWTLSWQQCLSRDQVLPARIETFILAWSGWARHRGVMIVCRWSHSPSSLLASTESCISDGCWQMWVWSCTSVPVLMTSLLGQTELSYFFIVPLTFVWSTFENIGLSHSPSHLGLVCTDDTACFFDLHSF